MNCSPFRYLNGCSYASKYALPFMPRVGVSKVGGIFVHKNRGGLSAEKSTIVVREAVMQETLPADQDVTAQQLADELAELVEAELLEIVSTLHDADAATLFGPTEFKIRTLALKIAAKAYQQRLAQKKTATKARV